MKNEERFMVMIKLVPKSKNLVFYHFSLFIIHYSLFVGKNTNLTSLPSLNHD